MLRMTEEELAALMAKREKSDKDARKRGSEPRREISEPERAFAQQIAASGLPGCEREFAFCPGRRWRFDFAWLSPRVAVEVEGGIWTNGRHTRGKGFEADCEKYAEALSRGWRVLRVTPSMVKDRSALTYLTGLLT
jgi:very-short-patch-repair endonuclease